MEVLGSGAGGDSQQPQATDLTGVCFSDPLWLQAYPLNGFTALDYFALSPFYDPSCNNEKLRLQQKDISQLPTMPPGMEYVVTGAQEPNLYIIRKQQRLGPDKTAPLAVYYVLDGSIYQAPQLFNVLGSRAARCLYHIQQAFAEASAKLDKVAEKEEESLHKSREGTPGRGEDAGQPQKGKGDSSRQVDIAEVVRMDRIIMGVLQKLPAPVVPSAAQAAGDGPPLVATAPKQPASPLQPAVLPLQAQGGADGGAPQAKRPRVAT